MNSLILQTWCRLLKPLMLIFSVFMLMRGHQEPGGGFIGGMVAAAAFTLSALAFGVTAAKQTLHAGPMALAAVGLITAVCSGLIGPLIGLPFMTGTWWKGKLPLIGDVDLGTPLLFDVGVYLVVVGITLTIIFALMESLERDGN